LAQADSQPQVGGGWINAPKSSLGFCQKSGNEAHFFQRSHGEGTSLQSPSGLTIQCCHLRMSIFTHFARIAVRSKSRRKTILAMSIRIELNEETKE
jgi:hypothetical protein